MDRATALDAVDLESSRFLVAASNGAAPLDAPVPTCPGWDVAQLVRHVGFIYSRLALVVTAQRTEVPDRSELPDPPDGEARLGWFAEQRTAMLAALEAASGDTLVWNWTGNSPGPTSFWFRRMAHETLIHRVDMELARGSEPTEADPEVATDTVTEFFELFYPMFETQLSRNRSRWLPTPSRHRCLRRGMDTRCAPRRLVDHARTREGRRFTSGKRLRACSLGVGPPPDGSARDLR